MNLYGFAGGDPINLADPLGLFPCCAPIEVGAGVLGIHGYHKYVLADVLARTDRIVVGVVLATGGGTGGFGSAGSEAGALHHIATDKNAVSTLRGGPWTPRFEAVFEKAGIELKDEANKIWVNGHFGPHPEAYHRAIFDRLTSAVEGLEGQAYRDALKAELTKLGTEVQAVGSDLNKLITRGPKE